MAQMCAVMRAMAACRASTSAAVGDSARQKLTISVHTAGSQCVRACVSAGVGTELDVSCW